MQSAQVSCKVISWPDIVRVYCCGVPPEGPSAPYQVLRELDLADYQGLQVSRTSVSLV